MSSGEGSMLGFAILDAQASDDATTVWLTSRVEVARADHTNAVVVQHGDADHDRKVRALTADRCVVLTPGSLAPIAFHHALGLDAIIDLIDETSAHQKRIVDAIAAYSARTRNRDLVVPAFAPAPQPPRFACDDRRPRALVAADYVARAWSTWLATDEQRRRRAVDPRGSTSSWIMPTELADTTVAELPSVFAERARPEPLSQC